MPQRRKDSSVSVCFAIFLLPKYWRIWTSNKSRMYMISTPKTSLLWILLLLRAVYSMKLSTHTYNIKKSKSKPCRNRLLKESHLSRNKMGVSFYLSPLRNGDYPTSRSHAVRSSTYIEGSCLTLSIWFIMRRFIIFLARSSYSTSIFFGIAGLTLKVFWTLLKYWVFCWLASLMLRVTSFIYSDL